MAAPTQSRTPVHLLNKPNKKALVDEYLGRSLDTLRTPAMIIDRQLFSQNCANMHRKAQEWGATFRAHLKTHKTVEGTRLQLESVAGQTHAVVVSTLMEAWEVVHSGLIADRTVQDILYGLPLAVNKLEDLSALRAELEKYGAIVRLLVDHSDQVRFLEEYENQQEKPQRWSIFIKINGGQNRAGVVPGSQEFSSLLEIVLSSQSTNLYGFYGHAGDSYGSTSLSEASAFLSGEVDSVNLAAKYALEAMDSYPEAAVSQPFVLSVGSTPTAHAASAETRKLLSQILNGRLELHAGNYPMLDLQQHHTGLIDRARISQRVRATVISYYPKRGPNGEDEAMIDAGAIAFSKDTGPSGTYGEVIGMPWTLSRISQEHGILTCHKSAGPRILKLGTVVDIVGQHACLIAAAHPWYYIVDPGIGGGREVVDVWVPWKGW